jgi:phosphatidate cytidylyltransferase
MLKQRVITAAIGLPLLLWALLYGPPALIYGFFLLCATLSVYEIAQLVFPPFFRLVDPTAVQPSGYRRLSLLCVVTSWCVFFSATLGMSEARVGGIVAVLSSMILVATFSGSSIPRSVVQICGSLVSLCYGCLPWLCIWDIYLMGEHARYILLLITIVMMGDTGAYFTGLKWGKHTLAPRYSPKKTWEGLAGGLVASVLSTLLLNRAYAGNLGPWWLLVIIALLAGLAGSLGDLVESTFKRFAQVKDSGAIFPGHGGFLDRADSLLFAAPILWLLLYGHHLFLVR